MKDFYEQGTNSFKINDFTENLLDWLDERHKDVLKSTGDVEKQEKHGLNVSANGTDIKQELGQKIDAGIATAEDIQKYNAIQEKQFKDTINAAQEHITEDMTKNMDLIR